jgi:hypothetical protein
MTNAIASQYNAYAVALALGQMTVVNAMIAPSPEAASALLVAQFLKDHPDKAGELSGCAVALIQPDFMRAALRAIETGIAPGAAAPVLSLVTQSNNAPAEPPTPEPVWRTDGTCVAHGAWQCHECEGIQPWPLPRPAE